MAEGQAAASRISGAPDPLLGRVINDRFKITSLIARGGMGKVYRAEQAPLGRLCAVKVLNPAYSGEHDPEFHKRFFLEASIASKLTHPNTVTIFDYGRTDDDVYYMAMELLDGVTLHRAIREAGSFPEERVAHISRQICRALREAHALGVIHRDLKPANVFLVEHGDETDFVKILDFGLVKNVALDGAPDEQLTQTGLFMGSPKYMAPEQVRGDRVDARTDIYSLGIIMYEMLTGRVPFDRPNSLNILMAQVNEDAPPIRLMNPNAHVSPPLEELVGRCMAKDPASRYTTMNDVLLALKHLAGMNALSTGEWRLTSASGPHSALSASQAMPGQLDSGHRPIGPTSGLGVGGSQPGGRTPSVSPGPMAGPSSGNLPLPLRTRADLSAGFLEAPPRRSRFALFVGMLGVFGVAAALTVVAMRASGPSAQVVGAPATQPTAAQPSQAPPSDTTLTVTPATIKLHLVSEPLGAVVKEDGKELCASTPCDHEFDSDPAVQHKLVFTKPGYRSETRVVSTQDGPVVVRLGKASWSPPPAKQVDRDREKEAPTPQGFKELPY